MMRTSLLALALASLAPTTSADACGPMPAPHLFAVSQHFTRDGARTFVVLDDFAPPNTKWTRLAPGTYDGSSIAPAPALDQPMLVTLVGASGTRVVTSDRRVYLRSVLDSAAPHLALEVDVPHAETFEVAIAGRTDATWHALVTSAHERTDTWLDRLAITDVEYMWIAHASGTDVAILSFSSKQGLRLAIRRGDSDLGVHAGSALGVLDARGRRFVVLRDRTTVAV
jgi:hypothetical protein